MPGNGCGVLENQQAGAVIKPKEVRLVIESQEFVMIPGPAPAARSIQDRMAQEIAAFGDVVLQVF